MSAGSLLLSSAILFTGNTYTRIKEFMEVANLCFFSDRAIMKLQTKVLFVSVKEVYKMELNKITLLVMVVAIPLGLMRNMELVH